MPPRHSTEQPTDAKPFERPGKPTSAPASNRPSGRSRLEGLGQVALVVDPLAVAAGNGSSPEGHRSLVPHDLAHLPPTWMRGEQLPGRLGADPGPPVLREHEELRHLHHPP